MFNATLDESWAAIPEQSEVDRQLAEWGIWDVKMTPLQRRERYIRFEQLDFGVAPESCHAAMRRELLQFETMLACYQHDVGLVQGHAFHIEMHPNAHVFHKPTPFPPAERQWVKDEMAKLQRTGVVSRVHRVECASNIVLVPQGQSGQSYRLCINFTDINARSVQDKYPMPDQREILDSCEGGSVFTALDIKSGFHNVVIAEECKKYLGVVTQDGLFRCDRIIFGLTGAPGLFQFILDSICASIPGVRAYIDDLKIQGSEWWSCWRQTVAVIGALANAGLMLNLRKSKMLRPNVELLGHVVNRAVMQLNYKCIQSWLEVGIPRNVQQLQVVLGRLMWASPFIPHYKQTVAPLEALLSSKGPQQWTPACTAALNTLIGHVFHRLQLSLPRVGEQFRVYPDFDHVVSTAVLTQGEAQAPVAVISRHATAREQRMCPLERIVTVVHWALHKLARYTMFAPAIQVYLPQHDIVTAIGQSNLHLRVRALLVDLQTFTLEWKVGESAWQIQANWVDYGQRAEQLDDGPKLTPPSLTHVDVDLKPASSRRRSTGRQGAWVGYFDGGSRGGRGSGGFAVWDSEGVLQTAQGRWYDVAHATNNTAEVHALVDLMQWCADNLPSSARWFTVKGDSQLIIDFCTRQARPGRQPLVLAIQRVRDIRRALAAKVDFVHVRREYNQLADWLALLARSVGSHIDVTAACAKFTSDTIPPLPAEDAATWVANDWQSWEVPQSEWLRLQSHLAARGLSAVEVAAAFHWFRKYSTLEGSVVLCPRCHCPLLSTSCALRTTHVCHRCQETIHTPHKQVGNPLFGTPLNEQHGQWSTGVAMLAPVFDPVTFTMASTGRSRPRRVPRSREVGQCWRCGLLDCHTTAQCWGCGGWYHAWCFGRGWGEVPPGVTYCRECRDAAIDRGDRDVTLDEALMRSVALDVPAPDLSVGEARRVSRIIHMYRWDGVLLWYRSHIDCQEREVPPPFRRQRIVEQMQASLGYPSGRRLLILLKQRYYWQGMAKDCVRICGEAAPYQIDRAKFSEPAYLLPTRKSFHPFHTWCIDLITHLPPGEQGETILVTCVCAFSKWLEAAPLRSRSSFEVAQWFHRDVVCRFGAPHVVRCDSGTEFKGHFSAYLAAIGVRVRRIAVAHPRANGLIERYNGVLRDGLRRTLTACTGAKWTEVLGDVLAGVRLLPTKLGVSPYVLVYKQEPTWGGASHEALVGDDLVEPVEDDRYWASVLKAWDALLLLVKERLNQGDAAMVKAYRKRVGAAAVDPRHSFAPGQLVLLKQRLPGKQTQRAVGPLTFVSYVGRLGVTVVLRDQAGKEITASAAHIVPYRGDVDYARPLTRAALGSPSQPLYPPIEQESGSEDGLDSDSDSDFG